MTRFVNYLFLLLTLFLLSSVKDIYAQVITSPESDNFVKINSDTAYIFCTTRDKNAVGTLTAVNPLGVSSTFTWEKLDTLSGTFNSYSGFVQEDTLRSVISRLEDGLYRVTVNSGGNIISDQAYVLNNWIEAKAEIPDSTSTCEGFKIVASYETAPMRYFDLSTSTMKELRNRYINFSYKWEGNGWTSSELSPYFPPIASDKSVGFNLTINDNQFIGCSGTAEVEYDSKIPKSDFTYDPSSGEAVLKVTFTNKSINYDSVMWNFYKSDSIIKIETSANEGKTIDSIDFVLTDDAPVYSYEWCGKYKVKLVTVKVNPTTGNCYDTLYMADYINVENALVEAPNVFTPNGDTYNDVFVVKSKSLKSMSIKIYNRWGGLVHSWSYNNITGRDYTYKHSVWDGRVNGGAMATPGVYFYVIRAVGRDGSKQNKEGFVHLFRDKK
jgi:gliding motility-associated-like protein